MVAFDLRNFLLYRYKKNYFSFEFTALNMRWELSEQDAVLKLVQ